MLVQRGGIISFLYTPPVHQARQPPKHSKGGHSVVQNEAKRKYSQAGELMRNGVTEIWHQVEHANGAGLLQPICRNILICEYIKFAFPYFCFFLFYFISYVVKIPFRVRAYHFHMNAFRNGC